MKNTFGKKLKYLFNSFISRGFLAQILLLIVFAILLTLLFGIFATSLGEPNYSEGYWTSLMHMIDQGTITGDREGSNTYFVFMLGVTFVGMIFTSTIIAIINNGITAKLDRLNKGYSAIAEKNHIVVLGFNENTCTICHEILESVQKSGSRSRVVLADGFPKETMENAVRDYYVSYQQLYEKQENPIKKNKYNKIFIRSGELISENTFSICAVERAKAIVINQTNDMDTIRIILALAAYLRKMHAYISDDNMPTVVALINENRNLSAAKSAAGITFKKGEVKKEKNEHKVRILDSKKVLGHLFAQACMQQGMPYVMDGLFNSRGASIYIEQRKEDESSPFAEKSLSEISEVVSGSIPMGFIRKDESGKMDILLNPSDTTTYQPEDRLIYLSRSPGLFIGKKESVKPEGEPAAISETQSEKPRNFLVIGWSDALPGMMKIVERYYSGDWSATIVSGLNHTLPECGIRFQQLLTSDAHCWDNILQVFEENRVWFEPNGQPLTNIVILPPEGMDKGSADEHVMVLLLNIRQYLKDNGLTNINITSELHLPQNQMLLSNNSCNDFVVASEISYRIMTQILDNPRKYYIIEDLLKTDSQLIRLEPLANYVDTTRDFNFEGVFRYCSLMSAEDGSRKIPLGWIRIGQVLEQPGELGSGRLVLAPTSTELEKTYPGGDYSSYRLVVLTGKCALPSLQFLR